MPKSNMNLDEIEQELTELGETGNAKKEVCPIGATDDPLGRQCSRGARLSAAGGMESARASWFPRGIRETSVRPIGAERVSSAARSGVKSGGLYVQREENASWLFVGTVEDESDAKEAVAAYFA